ncbi:hypothetical protein JCM14076_20630 [Methylosoma difficile]
MLTWLKRIAITLLALLALLFVLLRQQGWQTVAAYTGGGFARPLPDASKVQAQNCHAQPLRVMSFNVMYGSAVIESLAATFRGGSTGKDELPWSVRLPEIRERIASYQPDLLGLQEMGEDDAIHAIVDAGQYSLVSYHLGGFQYGDSALLYKTARFEPLDAAQLWLGNSPELPMSLGFRRLSMIRYANWALLRDKSSGFTFLFVNSHFDNASVNKEPSATLFRERITQLAKAMPVIVTGDFNTTADTERYRRFSGTDVQPPLLQNAYTLAHSPTVEPALHPDKRIDHILAGGPCPFSAEQWLLDTRPLKNGKMMSDHDALFTILQVGEPATPATNPPQP